MTSSLTEVIKVLDKAVVHDLRVYDMKEITPFYDYSIIASVNSSRQGRSAIDYLKKAARNLNLTIRSFNAANDSRWFLIDLNEIVVHVFVGDERDRFNLDGLYAPLKKH